jgi:quercetin dioxygenase-like cupin family protein
MSNKRTIKLVRPGEGKTVTINADQITFKITVDENHPEEASFVEIMTPPGGGAPLHRHASETFYVYEGEFEFFGAKPEDTIAAATGDFICIPPGVPHGYTNVGTTTGNLLIVTVSSWFQNFLEEIAAIEGSLDMETMTLIGQKHGIEIIGPRPT